jgi:hypothetical protein
MYRIRREDGALSQWVEISGTVSASVAVLSTITGFDKKSNLSVTGSPALVAQGNASVGAPQCSRASLAVAGQRAFEVTITNYTNNTIVFGLEDRTTNLNSGTPAPGSSNAAGVAFRVSSTGFNLLRHGVSVSSGSGSNCATGDVFSIVFDTTAGTMKVYRTRSATTVQVGSTMTGISLSVWNAYVGTYTASTITANFGATAFTRALDSGYSIYG